MYSRIRSSFPIIIFVSILLLLAIQSFGQLSSLSPKERMSITRERLPPSAEPQTPVPLIFDTDMGNDVDDALALGLIHALQSRGHCELKAVTITKDHPLSAPFIDLLNTFYGHPDIPIGIPKNGIRLKADRFLELARVTDQSGENLHPYDLAKSENAEKAVPLLRRILAESDDGSVAVVQVGFSTNLSQLIDSEPDAISPMSGHELVSRKVRLLSLMAGTFEYEKLHLEFNVKHDIPSAQNVAFNWPTPVTWSGFEVGVAIPYPSESIENDYNYLSHHPIKDAYYLYIPPPHDRPCWDLTSVLAAVWPDRGYFSLSQPGTVNIQDDGFSQFIPNEDGQHRYMKVDKEQIIRMTEAFVQLCSQKPDR